MSIKHCATLVYINNLVCSNIVYTYVKKEIITKHTFPNIAQNHSITQKTVDTAVYSTKF